MIIALTIVIVWVACGIYACGSWFAYFQNKYPDIAEVHYDDDRRGAFIAFAWGPIAAIVEATHAGFKYGWRWPKGKR